MSKENIHLEVATRYLMASEDPNKYEDKVTGDGKSVGVFLPLPKRLADQFESLEPMDDSPCHVTLFYGINVPEERLAEFLQIVRDNSADLPRIMKARIGQLEYFQNPHSNLCIPHMSVQFSADMGRFKINTLEDLKYAGFEINDFNPNIFFPHVTLGYFDDLDAKWKGPIPAGTWEFDRFEVWGAPELYDIKLG